MTNQQKQQIEPQGYAERLAAVRTFARQCNYEVRHCEQVTSLAERLFDRVSPFFHFTEKHRFWLMCGAILHDIGWKEGQQKHHKTSMQMILSDTTMPLDSTERKMASLIARYHRKSLPKPEHSIYGDLTDKEQRIIKLLAGIVRLADGLDRTHTEIITDLTVKLQPERITIVCKNKGYAQSEINYGKEKADLLECATGCTVEISAAKS